MVLVKAKSLLVAMTIGAAAARGQPMDARVSTTKGQSAWLAQMWGKPTVMFYEDKNGAFQNQSLKDELFKRGREQGLLEAVSVVAIANVKAFDWFPAKNFVVAAVKDAEQKAGVPVYLDWSGVMSGPPWNLSATGSTVMVIDAAGEQVLFSKEGKLSQAEIEELFELLGKLVR